MFEIKWKLIIANLVWQENTRMWPNPIWLWLLSSCVCVEIWVSTLDWFKLIHGCNWTKQVVDNADHWVKRIWTIQLNIFSANIVRYMTRLWGSIWVCVSVISVNQVVLNMCEGMGQGATYTLWPFGPLSRQTCAAQIRSKLARKTCQHTRPNFQ